MTTNPRIDTAWWTLRIGLGLAPLLAGLDKFFNILANWEMYLNPLAPRLLHISATTFMHLVGIIEIVVGILVLTKLTRYAAYIIMVWMWAIALNLITQGQFLDIAVRDILISLAAFTLAKLSEVREMASAEDTASPRRTLNGPEATPRIA